MSQGSYLQKSKMIQFEEHIFWDGLQKKHYQPGKNLSSFATH